jgi:hypothetical protein
MRTLVLAATFAAFVTPALAEGCNFGAKQVNASVKQDTTTVVEATPVTEAGKAEAIRTAEAPVQATTAAQ